VPPDGGLGGAPQVRPTGRESRKVTELFSREHYAEAIRRSPGLRIEKPGLAARRTALLTIQLVKEAPGVKSTRGRSNAGQNRQGKKCCNKDDPHDYLL
jgi:hypothetical protein